MWETIKYAAGLDSLSGVKYDPSNVFQWASVNEAKKHNRSDKDPTCREWDTFGNYRTLQSLKQWSLIKTHRRTNRSHRLTAERPPV